MKGLVKWFSNEKGYGFITSDLGQDHYFNIQSTVGAELPKNGDSVEFESKQGNKGPRAVNVKIIQQSVQQSSFNTKDDDRIICPGCNKKIVPRMITYKGEPDKSVCPYCAATVKSFRNKSRLLGLIIFGLLALALLVDQLRFMS